MSLGAGFRIPPGEVCLGFQFMHHPPPIYFFVTLAKTVLSKDIILWMTSSYWSWIKRQPWVIGFMTVPRLGWFGWLLGLYPCSLSWFLAGDWRVLSLGFLDWLGSSERLVRKSATPRTGVPETCKYSQRILELCVAFDRWGSMSLKAVWMRPLILGTVLSLGRHCLFWKTVPWVVLCCARSLWLSGLGIAVHWAVDWMCSVQTGRLEASWGLNDVFIKLLFRSILQVVPGRNKIRSLWFVAWLFGNTLIKWFGFCCF